MPNMSSHMAIAKKVGELLHIDDSDFIRGNIIPDLYDDKEKSHYKIQGKLYRIPNISYVEKALDLQDKKNLGILTHLLLDKYYLEDYLSVKYPSIDVFVDNVIYNDYDIINKDIVKHFNLDKNYIKSELNKITEKELIEKLNKNIKCLSLNKEGKTTYIEINEFIKFLEEISIKIANDIRLYN